MARPTLVARSPTVCRAWPRCCARPATARWRSPTGSTSSRSLDSPRDSTSTTPCARRASPATFRSSRGPELPTSRGGTHSSTARSRTSRRGATTHRSSCSSTPSRCTTTRCCQPGRGPPLSPQAYLDCVLGRTPCSDEAWAELAKSYRAEIAQLDQGMARLLEAVDDAGLGEVYFVLVSDHGEGFDPRHGRIHHGGRLHGDL